MSLLRKETGSTMSSDCWAVPTKEGSSLQGVTAGGDLLNHSSELRARRN